MHAQLVIAQSYGDLQAFLRTINKRPVPSVYDLGGTEMFVQSSGHGERLGCFKEVITQSDVTIRNGTLVLSGASSDGMHVSIEIKGQRIIFENLSISGGVVGISVAAGGSVVLKSCQITGCKVGDLVVRGGKAVMHECLVTGVGGDGIRMEGAASPLVATHVRCTGNLGHGLYVSSGDALLEECVFAGNKAGSICAVGWQSKVEVRAGRYEPAPDVLGGGQVTGSLF